jgi:cyclophilin family peptidyl-prolyl cis-trans isomerase
MGSTITALAMLFSVLAPQKMWFTASQPILVFDKSDKDVTLAATDFSGKAIAAAGSADVGAGQSVDLKKVFPPLATVGTYLVYAGPKGSAVVTTGAGRNFLGTPMVVEVIPSEADQSPMVTRVVPLCDATIETNAGKMRAIFYYDVAPHTVNSFLELSGEGFYDGLIFHRIVPDFVIQGGDPSGNGTGGPGYHIDAEFNSKKHLEGVLSMARNGDPDEDPSSNVGPRPQYANSAGSQFFICLNYQNTQSLDRHYTAFGRVFEGMDVVKKIGTSPVANPDNGTPQTPTTIQTISVAPVTSNDDPYDATTGAAATQP